MHQCLCLLKSDWHYYDLGYYRRTGNLEIQILKDMAKIQVRNPLPSSTLQPIGQNWAIDLSSIMGSLFTSSFTINLSLKQQIDFALNSISGIRIKDLRLTDLMLPAYYCNGIYVFYDLDDRISQYDSNIILGNHQKVVYVGKAGGRSFIERIAAHFTSRNNDFMNNMLKNLSLLLKKRKDDSGIDQVFPIAKEFLLKIIYFPACSINVDANIAMLEKELIKYYKPLLNK